MSISSMSSSQVLQSQTNNVSKPGHLTSGQQAFIEELLSQYDSDSLSANDAKEIVQAFSEAGIEPSVALDYCWV